MAATERAAAAAAATERSQPPPAGHAAAAGNGGGAGTELSLPGILHFIQHEWARFEAEKGRWEAERAELQAQVAFLQGERKGQENLKTDLVRRIKMLEFALKQERSKYHKLKFGTELPPGEKKAEGAEPASNGPTEVASLEAAPLAWKEGRQLLRQYLEEVGYSDTILDMRSRRVRSLLGRCPQPQSLEAATRGPPGAEALLGGGAPQHPPALQSPPATSRGQPGAESLLARRIQEQIQRNAGKESEERGGPGGGGGLEQVPFPGGSEEEDSDEEEEEEEEEEDAQSLPPTQHRKQRSKLPSSPLLPELEDEEDEEDSEDALNEFHFLASGENGAGEGLELGGHRAALRGLLAVDGLPAGSSGPRLPEGSLGLSSEVFLMESIGGAGVSLGDLADLTVSNDHELGSDGAEGQPPLKKSWSPKFTLRSHYDAVRGLAFHPAQPALLTASEDGTLKLWNLQRPPGPPKKNSALDLEPVYAFRGHRGAVLAVAMGSDRELCCSAGLDSLIRCWRLPDLDADPYQGYDPGVLQGALQGHGDAVWALAFNPPGDLLASCSADGSVRLWHPRGHQGPPLATFDAQREHGVPTSVTFSATHPAHAAVAFRSGATLLYDVEVAQPLLVLQPQPGGAAGGSQVNQVVAHPSQPLSITASDDRSIRVLDNRTGKVVHSMVAHLDAVTCLAVDPSGVFLLSGSHDCSLRLWHLGQGSCVQELPAHRRKHSEAVLAVAFHCLLPLAASAGADGLAKVFV